MTGQKGRSGGARPHAGRPRTRREPQNIRISADHARMLAAITERWNARKPADPVTPRRVVELLIAREALALALEARDS